MIPDSVPGGHSIITVDCRELEPPEPMVVVLEAVDKLQKNGGAENASSASSTSVVSSA